MRACATRTSPSRWKNWALSMVFVMDRFTYAPPMTDAAHPSSLLLPPVLPSTAGQRRGLFPAQLGDPTSPSSERRRTERETSRSRELSAWSSGCKRQCTPLVEGRVCAEWQNTLSPQLSAGGRSTVASLLPTKTLALGGDTGTDHPSVPACVK